MAGLVCLVYLEGHSAIVVNDAMTADEALAQARKLVNDNDAKHLCTEVFQGQLLHEVIRG